jgi:hypothetical protein
METVENVVKDFNYAEVETKKNVSEVLLWQMKENDQKMKRSPIG